MITIHINRNVEKPGYWMSMIDEDNMRDVLYLRFDCPACVSAVIDTLTFATTDEIDLTNYAWEDWEDGTTCCKRPKPTDYVDQRGN